MVEEAILGNCGSRGEKPEKTGASGIKLSKSLIYIEMINDGKLS